MIETLHHLAWTRVGILAALGLVVATYVVLAIASWFRPRF